jgi:hypothetical protein
MAEPQRMTLGSTEYTEWQAFCTVTHRRVLLSPLGPKRRHARLQGSGLVGGGTQFQRRDM